MLMEYWYDNSDGILVLVFDGISNFNVLLFSYSEYFCLF